MDRLKYMMGLMASCPYHEAVSNCPFNKYRSYPIDKLISHSFKMHLSKTNDLLERHKVCYQKRREISKAG